MRRALVYVLALFLIAPLAAHADAAYLPTSLTPADVFKKNADATGNLAIGTYESRSMSHGGGMEVDFTSYYGGGDDITHVVEGPFESAYGTYDGHGWDQDSNGTVTLDTGFHGKENPNAIALDHPDVATNRVTMLGLTTTKPAQYAIDVNPPGGDHEILYYDASTFLLSREVTLDGNTVATTRTYDDYRTVFGETTWFHSTFSDGHPENDSDEHVLSFKRIDAPIDFNIPTNRPLVTFASTAPVTLPVRFIDGSIIVRVTIKGRGLDFLLDSGASTLTINPDVARDLGLTAYGRRSGVIGGRFTESPTIVPDMAIGDLQMRDVALEEVAVDEQHLGIAVVGLLGYDFIRSAVLAIDFKNQTVTIYPPGATAPNPGPIMRVPIELDDGIPRVAASFDGVPGKFLIDTGAESTILFPDYFRGLKGKVFQSDGYQIEFVGGIVNTQAYTIDHAAFGPAAFDGLDVLVPQSTSADIPDYDGILGRDTLGHYLMFLDYADQVVYLQARS